MQKTHHQIIFVKNCLTAFTDQPRPTLENSQAKNLKSTNFQISKISKNSNLKFWALSNATFQKKRIKKFKFKRDQFQNRRAGQTSGQKNQHYYSLVL